MTKKREIKRVLVIRESAIGDVLCMTPFLRIFKQEFPDAVVDYVVVDWAKDVIKNNPNIDNIYTVKNDLIFGNKYIVALKRLKFYFEISKIHYDIVFCPTSQFLYKLTLISFLKARKVGFSHYSENRLNLQNFMLDDIVFRPADPVKMREHPHVVKTNLEMLEKVLERKVTDDKGLEIFTDNKDREKIDILFNELDCNDNAQFIAIAAGAGSLIKPDAHIKTIPPDKVVEIALKIVEKLNVKILFIGAATEFEYVEGMKICNQKTILNLCGKFNINETTELLKRVSLVISNDSGISHIASALKKNHIVFFGPTFENIYGPYLNPNAIVVREPLSCAPCHKPTCIAPESPEFFGLKKPYCLAKINSEKIVDLVESQIRSNSLK